MPSSTPTQPTLQSYDFFLVFDVEATCQEGAGMDYPNEIIEWPVCLLGWRDKTNGILDIVSEFRTFVKPTWRPQLSEFCTRLTGITQDQTDNAPSFPDVIQSMADFLITHRILDETDCRPLVRFCWCSDGPWDICDFVVKQCFISKVNHIILIEAISRASRSREMKVPQWISNQFIDVRVLLCGRDRKKHRTMNISKQLQVLQLGAFIGRPHSGIDDARNISRVLIELARRSRPLLPTTVVNVRRRWKWMGRAGKIIEAEL
ncbi:ribonuclease H-like domain-containing protein [Thelephora terrestris]|uniref:Ribonuclease H-like domain-containing protein n=1 Tax=Thelephora terrestris TaxID=56493 RepID=A0A9P6LBF7_9AGAM|nr:ribonuclease H-like domain-containing protein [Thelephora terrestris]